MALIRRDMKTRPRFFYGWLLVAVGVACEVFIYGLRNSFAVFYVAILDQFHWSRADTALIFSINIIVYGLTAPVAGALMERFGPRKLMSVGLAIMVLGTMACSQASQIWHLYLLYGVVMAVGANLAGYGSNLIVLSHWFVRKRGTAFGILLAGWGLSFVFATPAEYLVANFGWQNAFFILGSVVLVVLMPLILIFEKLRPSDMGLLPDGDAGTEGTMSQTSAARLSRSLVVDEKWANTDWTLGKALRSYRYNLPPTLAA